MENSWGFPIIRELPTLLTTKGCNWNKKQLGIGMDNRSFWIGTDTQGNSWVVKMRGASDAIRERVYSSLAQTIGICTQSSVYLVLSDDAGPLWDEARPRFTRTPQHGALWMLDEHGIEPCGPGCPYSHRDHGPDFRSRFESWLRCGVQNPWDRYDAAILGYLCGKFEPSGNLITASHLWLQIDNECMFSWFERGKTNRDAINDIRKDPLMKVNGATERIAALCARVTNVTDAELELILEVPNEYRAKTQVVRLRRWLRQARRTAEWIAEHGLQ